jgi:NADPH:quinone reductase-like Zn-dependent oxidoreductase
VSLNYSNLMVLTHTYPIPPRPSLIPGLDGAGTIEATGANSKWSAGDKVVVHHCNWLTGDVENLRFDTIIGAGENNGTLQRYMVLDDERVVRAPRNLSIEEAGTLHTAGATVVNALFWGARRAQRGDTVLTMGTGGVSCFAIQVCRNVRLCSWVRCGEK